MMNQELHEKNLKIWRGGYNANDDEIFQQYMKFIGIEPPEYEGVGLRLHHDLRCDERKAKLPAIIACLVTPDDELAAIHRVYIEEGGRIFVRSTTEPAVPIIGSSVRLFSAKNATSLIVATSIETALTLRASMYRNLGELLPCWATLDAQTMRYLVVPETIRKITLVVDNDVDYASQSAGYHLANRLMQFAGRRVAVLIPNKIASDLNDEMRHVEEEAT
jgi:hypothetical protein